jgi:cellulose biosynthesis protein BcsQ
MFKEAEFQYINMATTVIRERAIFRKVAPLGLAVNESDENKKADMEINLLYKEIYNG